MPELASRFPPDPDRAGLPYADDPWVQYLVARREGVASGGQLAAAAASATVCCAVRFADDAEHAVAYLAWRRWSYRKVCLQARPGEWRRLLREHGPELVTAGLAGDGGPVIAAVVPRHRSDASHLLGRILQAYRQPTAELDGHPPAPEAAPDVLLVVNGRVPMSPGKLAAQASHAALMLADSTAATDAASAPAVAAWLADGAPCRLARTTTATQWLGLQELPCCVVRDGGLTEVAPGSETVIALLPERASRRPAAVRALPLVG